MAEAQQLPARPAPDASLPWRSRRRSVRWVTLAIGAVVIPLVVVLASRASVTSAQAKSPLIGHPAPEVTGASVTGTYFSSLSAIKGSWVLVNFFATWCVPCRQEQPELVRFVQRHQVLGDVTVVMVTFDDDATKARSFLRHEGGTWPALGDPDGRLALSYGVTGVPETYLIDPKGFVVSKLVGGVTADGLDRLVTAAKQRDA